MVILRSAQIGSISGFCQRNKAFSITEMVVVISIIAILAAIVINSYGDLSLNAKRTIAYHRMEDLNNRLHKRSMAYKIYISAANITTDVDEKILLFDMQNAWPGQPQAPYFDPTYAPKSSSDIDEFRMRWAGERLEMLEPGTPGLGLQVPFDGSDYGPKRVYPPGASSSGR
jgi:prepilin-type N-terminal cleavage/methylation domain-containing protein